jgi:ribosome-binding protein aMBF1 (putative translation factor)
MKTPAIDRSTTDRTRTLRAALDVLAASRRPRTRWPRQPDTTLRHLMAELVEARHRAGLRQRQVAERLRTTPSAISRLERGRRSRPTLSTLEHYAMVVGCCIEIHIRRR